MAFAKSVIERIEVPSAGDLVTGKLAACNALEVREEGCRGRGGFEAQSAGRTEKSSLTLISKPAMCQNGDVPSGPLIVIVSP